MQNWISQNGGVVASVVIVVSVFNICMSAIQSVCNALKVREPSGLQKAGDVGAKLASWLSANTPTPQPAAAPAIKPAATP